MTADQIVQQLRSIRYDKRPTLTEVAAAAGLSRVTVYEVIQTGRVSASTAERLTRGLQHVRIR